MNLEEMLWALNVNFIHAVGIWPMIVSCDHVNEPSDSMKGGKLRST
jgi:hypothetical protein